MLRTINPVNVRKPSSAQGELVAAGQVVGLALLASGGKDVGDREAVDVLADFLRLADRTEFDGARYGLIGGLTCRVMQNLAEPEARQGYVNQASQQVAGFLLERVAPRYFTPYFNRHTPGQKAISLTATNTGRIGHRLGIATIPAVQAGLDKLDIGSKTAGNLLEAANRPSDGSKPFHIRHPSYRPTWREALATKVWPRHHMRQKVTQQLIANYALWSEVKPDDEAGSPLALTIHENMFGSATQVAHKALFEGEVPLSMHDLDDRLSSYRQEVAQDAGIMRVARRASATNLRKVSPMTSIGGMIRFDEDSVMQFNRPELSVANEARQRAQGSRHFREKALVCPASTVVGSLPAVVDMALLAQYQTVEILSEALA